MPSSKDLSKKNNTFWTYPSIAVANEALGRDSWSSEYNVILLVTCILTGPVPCGRLGTGATWSHGFASERLSSLNIFQALHTEALCRSLNLPTASNGVFRITQIRSIMVYICIHILKSPVPCNILDSLRHKKYRRFKTKWEDYSSLLRHEMLKKASSQFNINNVHTHFRFLSTISWAICFLISCFEVLPVNGFGCWKV